MGLGYVKVGVEVDVMLLGWLSVFMVTEGWLRDCEGGLRFGVCLVLVGYTYDFKVGGVKGLFERWRRKYRGTGVKG